MEHLVRIELINKELIAYLVNHHTTGGTLDDFEVDVYFLTAQDVNVQAAVKEI